MNRFDGTLALFYSLLVAVFQFVFCIGDSVCLED